MGTNTKKTRSVAAMVAAVMLAASGCVWAPELSRVRGDIQGQLPGSSFRRNIELTLGPIELALARAVISAIPDAREARPYLRGLSRVQIGVYEAEGVEAGGLQTPKRLRALLDDGWEVVVRVREPEESVWVLCRSDEKTVREVFVVVLNADELIMVKAKGRMDRLVEAAARDSRANELFPHDS